MGSPRDVSIVVRIKDATLSGLDSVKRGIKDWAGSVQGQVVGLFAADKLIGALKGFGQRALEETTSAERAFSQLSNTLGNIGVDARAVKPDIDAAVASLQKVAAIDDDDAVAALNRLVQVSGDYKQSLANLPLVADVAAAKNIDLADAATLVGKTMAGVGAKGLKDFGIKSRDAASDVEALRAKVRGAATVEMHTLGGALKAANIQFGEVAQAVGEVVASSPGFQGFLQSVVEKLRDGAAWLQQHKAMLQDWAATLFKAIRDNASDLSHMVGVLTNVGIAAHGAGVAMNTMFDFSEAGRAKNKAANEELRAALAGIKEEWQGIGKYAADAGDVQVHAAQKTAAELAKNKKEHDEQVAREKAEAAAKAQAEADRKIDEKIGLHAKAGTLPQFREQSLLALRGLYSETEAVLKGNVPLERRLVLMDRMAKIAEALGKLNVVVPGREFTDEQTKRLGGALRDRIQGREKQQAADDKDANTRHLWEDKPPGNPIDDAAIARDAQASAKAAAASVKPEDIKGPSGGVLGTLGQSLKEQLGPVEDAELSFQTLGKTIADITAGPILAFGDAIENSMEALISGSGNAGKAFLSTMTAAVKGVAAQKGKLFAGEALAALGEGFLGHPGAFAAAAKYGLAAAAMFALAGAAGGLGAGGGSGGGGNTPAAVASRTQDRLSDVGRGSVTAVLNGRKQVIDMADAADREMLSTFIKDLVGTRELNLVIND